MPRLTMRSCGPRSSTGCPIWSMMSWSSGSGGPSSRGEKRIARSVGGPLAGDTGGGSIASPRWVRGYLHAVEAIHRLCPLANLSLRVCRLLPAVGGSMGPGLGVTQCAGCHRRNSGTRAGQEPHGSSRTGWLYWLILRRGSGASANPTQRRCFLRRCLYACRITNVGR